MNLFRIVISLARTSDLSGTGAYRVGGRWNSRGTYMLYTSENSSLAMLETLVHFDDSDTPKNLYIVHLELDNAAPIYTLPDTDYPPDWIKIGYTGNRIIGDGLFRSMSWLGVRVRSAVNSSEYNCLLNPLFPGYNNLVKVKEVREIPVDERLIGQIKKR